MENKRMILMWPLESGWFRCSCVKLGAVNTAGQDDMFPGGLPHCRTRTTRYNQDGAEEILDWTWIIFFRSNSEPARLREAEVCSKHLGWSGFSSKTSVRLVHCLLFSLCKLTLRGPPTPTDTETCEVESPEIQSAYGRVLPSSGYKLGKTL